MAVNLGFDGQALPTSALPATGGRNWLSLASARNDPMQTFMWDVSLAFPPSLGEFPAELIEEIQLPLSRFDVDNVFFQGQRSYFAKFEEFSPVSIKFYEDIKATTTLYFQQWNGLIRDSSGNYGTPSQYKGSMSIYPLDPKNNKIVEIVLIGMFPISFGSLAFQSASGRQEPSLEFQIDFIDIRFAQ